MDPLFKKASADFDEGGAKGLLLNHLAIDAKGRIVFDSSDDAGDATAEGDPTRRKSDGNAEEEGEGEVQREETPIEEAQEEGEESVDIDIAALAAKFFPDLAQLDDQDICPSLKNYHLGDPEGTLDIPFLKAPDDWRQDKEKDSNENQGIGDKSGIYLDNDNAAGFDDEDGMLGGFDIPADTGFGEGGEAWARDAAIEPQMRVHNGGFTEGVMNGEDDPAGMGVESFDPEQNQCGVSLNHNRTEGGHEDILSYFDNALKKNWAGPEHWRIRKIKDITKAATPAPTKRKEKEPFEIDFASPLDPSLAELIYTPASSNSAISLPKTQWKSKTRNLLPDDKHFNSRHLLRLFLKPKARMGSRRAGFADRKAPATNNPAGEDDLPSAADMDEAFWARKEDPTHAPTDDENVAPQGAAANYDANFFQDDGGLAFPAGGGGPAADEDDDDDFADARENFSPGVEGEVGGKGAAEGMMGGIAGVLAGPGGGHEEEGAFGTQLVTQSRRLRPEYVQYARVAKKVDVRRLKEELWRGIGFGDVSLLCPFSFCLLSLPCCCEVLKSRWGVLMDVPRIHNFHPKSKRKLKLVPTRIRNPSKNCISRR